MPRELKEADAALKELGQRVRAGWAKQHPMPEKSRETVRNAVREEFKREMEAKRKLPDAERDRTPDKDKKRGPDKPGGR